MIPIKNDLMSKPNGLDLDIYYLITEPKWDDLVAWNFSDKARL